MNSDQNFKPHANPIREKSFEFALRIVNMYKLLTTERKEFIMSNNFFVLELRLVRTSKKL